MDIQAQKIVGAIFGTLKKEWDSAYLQKKCDDHRLYTAVFLILLIPLGLSDWLFDSNPDPKNSERLFLYRLFFFWLIIPAFAIFKVKNYRVVAAVLILALLISTVHTTLILNMLSVDRVLAISGVVTFPFFIFFLMIGLSLYIQISVLLISVVLPLFFVFDGALGEISQTTYFQVMLQSSLSTVFVMAIFSWSYYCRYGLEQALEGATRTDPLTGVANRRHFDGFIKAEITRSARLRGHCSLILLDIDHFKRINDVFGHPTGDRVICSLASLCVNNSRKIDLVARLGGEEFAIVMPMTNLEEARCLAERIRTSVEDLHILSDAGETVTFTVSLGICEFNNASDDSKANDITITESVEMERLINHADTALYQAKRNGRNQIALFSG
ncbi:GGDEF domain-containing protein [Salmonella enterica]|nr:GGDEF domain-containing protein [Salmonella enterica]